MCLCDVVISAWSLVPAWSSWPISSVQLPTPAASPALQHKDSSLLSSCTDWAGLCCSAYTGTSCSSELGLWWPGWKLSLETGQVRHPVGRQQGEQVGVCSQACVTPKCSCCEPLRLLAAGYSAGCWGVCVSVQLSSGLLLLLLKVFMVPRTVAALTALHKPFLS